MSKKTETVGKIVRFIFLNFYSSFMYGLSRVDLSVWVNNGW